MQKKRERRTRSFVSYSVLTFPVASTCKLVAFWVSSSTCIIGDKQPVGLSQSPDWLADELRAITEDPRI